MRGQDFLPDHLDQGELNGGTVRKGTVGAFLVNARTLSDPAASEAARATAEGDILEALPALKALGLFDLFEIRDERLRALVGVRQTVTIHPAPSTPDILDVLGPTIEIVGELGAGDDDLCLIRCVMPAGTVVPLHSHRDRESLLVTEGSLEILQTPGVAWGWATVDTGGFVDIPGDVPHALRNRSDASAVLILVTTMRIARFFRAISRPARSLPPGPPPPELLQRFVETSQAFGYWLGTPEENAAIGLSIG